MVPDYSCQKNSDELKLENIIDAEKIQSLIDNFYTLTEMPISIIDLEGKLLVEIGWQDICTHFHRVHSQTRKQCMENELQLSKDASERIFTLYKCKNNMWNIAAPILVDDVHLGSIFMGQFFFEGENIDCELFLSQVHKYGFDKEEYMTELKQMPRFSKKKVFQAMHFYMELARVIAEQGRNNIRLSQALEEHRQVVDDLKTERDKLSGLLNSTTKVMDSAAIWINTLDKNGNVVLWNKAAENISGYTAEEVIGHARIWEWLYPVPDYRAEILEKVQEIIEKGRKAENFETQIRTKDGLRRTISWYSNNLVKDGEIIGSIALGSDITGRRSAEQQLRSSHEKLEVLSKKILQGQEEDRSRLARELHDEVGQALTAVKLDLQMLDEELSGQGHPCHKRLMESVDLVDETIERVRRQSSSLRPPALDDIGLAAAVQSMAKGFGNRSKINTRVTTENLTTRFSKDMETALFRCIQEALTNVARHAKALNVNVALSQEPQRVSVTIKDDGIGFEPEKLKTTPEYIGLTGMKERVNLLQGTLEIDSKHKQGTCIYISIPL